MLIFKSQGCSCLCSWTTLKFLLQPVKPLGEEKSPKPCSSPDSVSPSGRCWKHNNANIFGSTLNDFCVDGATACLLPWLPHHKERPHILPTTTSNLICWEQGQAVLGLCCQMTIHPPSPVFSAPVLQQWVMLSLGNGSESYSVLVRIIMDIVLATVLLHCTTA